MIVPLIVVSLIVGTLIGCVGVGGILLIPALSVFAGLTTHVSMATALFTFIFTGIVGTYLFQRRGTIDWRITIPVCVGATFFGYIGALVNSKVDASLLNIILSLIIIFAGFYTMYPRAADDSGRLDGRSTLQKLMLVAIGATVGFGSGLTGVGGPVLSVPIMVIIGFSPLTSIATSQVIQIVAAISGTIGNLQYGAIDFGVGSWVTIVELIGVFAGVYLAHNVKTNHLRNIVGIACILVGGMIFLRSSGLIDML
ncbi:MAG: sulfite exporter TauE/SafE family protein [Desulfobacterium sp.]|nr:sulfite exporter TauE/SafE family protein [Desulfobacterium sp.]